MLAGNIAALHPGRADYPTDLATQIAELDSFRVRFGMDPPLYPAADEVELKKQFDALVSRLDGWEAACRALSEALVRDLGYLGVDVGSLRGFYSDSLTESPMTGICSVRQHTTQAACTGASETWTPAPNSAVPCQISEQTPDRDAVVVRDAVHVALAANWQDAGWAAAQVWRDGLPMAAESMGRLSQRDPASTAPVCVEQLVLLDNQGRPVWSISGPIPESRKLAQSVGRTPLSG